MLEFKIKTPIQHLKTTTDTLEQDSEEHKKFTFIREQLKFLYKKMLTSLLTKACDTNVYMIHAVSLAAYMVLHDHNILCLPSTATLRKVT
jgi:hypothetical protein